MIIPPGASGVAFSETVDGDLRGKSSARGKISQVLGISSQWAWPAQVHGNEVLEVAKPGEAGQGDAVWSATPGLPIAVFTADCYGVVLRAEEAVGVAHAGWRGASSSVVTGLIEQMSLAGHVPRFAYVGPGIGSCCYEVGPDVSRKFESHLGKTTWGSVSVDLEASIRDEGEGMEVWSSDSCTFHEGSWFSYRRDGATSRLATIGWIP